MRVEKMGMQMRHRNGFEKVSQDVFAKGRIIDYIGDKELGASMRILADFFTGAIMNRPARSRNVKT